MLAELLGALVNFNFYRHFGLVRDILRIVVQGLFHRSHADAEQRLRHDKAVDPCLLPLELPDLAQFQQKFDTVVTFARCKVERT